MSHDDENPGEPALPMADVDPSLAPAWVDLATHRAGHAVLAHIAFLLSPRGNDVPPAGSSRTSESPDQWAVGFVGEEKVGLELALLDERWRVLHAVPIGRKGSDIDHVVIGPPGVFTINTKHHRGKRLDVRGDAVFIGRTYVTYVHYVRNARHEAEGARTALTADLPTACPVTPIVCTVGATLRHLEPTDGVWFVEDHRLIAALTAQHAVLSPAQVDWLYDRARRSTTWTCTPLPGAAPDWVAEYARRLTASPARALPATASARSRPGPRVGRHAPTRPPGTSARRRKAAPTTRSPGRLVLALATLAVVLLVGPQAITACTGLLLAALPATSTTPGTAYGAGPPDQYLASDDVPVAVAGEPCPQKGARGRYPAGDLLLLCRQDADTKLIWEFADPWRRLPSVLAGWSCPRMGDHAQSVADRHNALICAKDDQGQMAWTPDPGWEPKA